MLYLLAQYWFPWLLIAAVWGIIVGWLTCSRERGSWFSGWVPLGLIIFVVGLLAAIFKLVLGRWGLWLETALLLFASYILGCCVGCWLKRLLGGETAAKPEALGVGGSQETPIMKPNARQTTLGSLESPDNPMNIASEPYPVDPLNVADHPGTRPVGLAAPRGGKADDLKRIRGIGKQNEGRLHGLGIWHFDQIGAWTKQEVEWVGTYLAFPGRIEREEWVSQAQLLASGQETEFSKRVAQGLVATSKDDGTLGQGNVAAVGDGFEGKRPAGLAAPRGGKPDDLKLINGVGRAIEDKLHAAGIWHFDQIAAMSQEELAWISSFSGFPGRALRENWAGESKILAAGGETEHSKAVKAGKIPSSLDKPKG